jgi:hypothetical protein
MISRPASPADLALATLLARPGCLPHKHRQVVDDRLGAKVRYSSEVPQPWNPSRNRINTTRPSDQRLRLQPTLPPTVVVQDVAGSKPRHPGAKYSNRGT